MEFKGREKLLEIAKLLYKDSSSKNSLLIKNDVIDSFLDIKLTKTINFKELSKLDNEKFDLIVGDLPMGMMKENWEDVERGINISEKKNWIILFQSLCLLNENGKGLYLVEPSFWENKIFIKKLEEEGFFIEAIFNTPKKIFYPLTALRPYLILISKNKSSKLFVAELEEDSNVKNIIKNLNEEESASLSGGLVLPEQEFRGFDKYKISKKLDKLSEQFKEFKEFKLRELAKEINLSKEFKEKPNSIYIPKIGNSPTIYNLNSAKLKHQNYFQVVLDYKFVKAEYLASFFASEIGKEVLNLLTSGSVIPHINKKNIEECIVPLPSMETQEKIISASKKLILLKEKVFEFEKELSLNPKSSDKIRGSLDGLLDSLEMLNEEDKMLSLIREGESKTLEFKETLSKNIHTREKDKNVEKSALKNIVAFLNTEGGILLIGVSDDGQIKGIEKDFYKSNDDYLKHLHNLIKDYIGINLDPLISPKIIEILGKKILTIECKKSEKEVFTKDKEFYYRSTPATEKLEGPELLDYINNHFKKAIVKLK
jgi:hypothetical protein